MIYGEYSKLRGQHALFSASRSNWIYYDLEEMIKYRCGKYATEIGTILHEYCYHRIRTRQKLYKYHKSEMMFELLREDVPPDVADCFDYDRVFPIMHAYVNDAIGFRMQAEEVVYFAPHFFGTADALSFKDNQLKIFDFKSGETPAKIEQLEIYAAYFCLQHDLTPMDIDIELRIYQSPEIKTFKPTASDIVPIMDKAITFNKYMNKLEE